MTDATEKLAAAVTEIIGDRCPDFDCTCIGCQTWAALDEVRAKLQAIHRRAQKAEGRAARMAWWINALASRADKKDGAFWGTYWLKRFCAAGLRAARQSGSEAIMIQTAYMIDKINDAEDRADAAEAKSARMLAILPELKTALHGAAFSLDLTFGSPHKDALLDMLARLENEVGR